MGLFQSSKNKNIRKTAREVTYLGLPHIPARKARTLSSVCPFFKLSYIDLYCCFTIFNHFTQSKRTDSTF